MQNNQELFYQILKTPLGKLRIVADQKHIHAIEFMDDTAQENGTHQSNPLIEEAKTQLLEYFVGNRKSFSLPTLQHGTAFQEKAWKEIAKIKFGKTKSYGEVAAAMKHDKAVRAVGTTCGKNSIAIVVPCHRVLQSGGKLGGYGGKLWRKEWLLEHEGVKL